MEIVNDEEDGKVETCYGLSEIRKHFRGVSKSKNKWRARIFHPKLKIDVLLGTYNDPEEASLVYQQKKAEFTKMYGSRYSSVSDSRGCKKGYKRLEKTSRDIVTTSEFSDQLTDGLKVPRGVRKMKSGKWGARIAGTLPNTRIWLGTFDNAEEAVRSYNKAKAEVAANLEKADESISINDKAKLELRVVDVPGEPEYTFGQSSPMTVFEPGNNINSSDVSDGSIISKGKEQKIACISDFDEAVSLGFINEYGQLVGMYSELDEQMKFSQPDEDGGDCFDGCSL